MKKSLHHRIAAAVTALATVGTLVLPVASVHAATPTLMKDTLSRETISTTATHSVSMTLPTGGVRSTNTLTITWSGFTGFFGTLVTTCGAGTASSTGTAVNALTLTGSSDCTGTLTITGINMVNPSSAGSKTVTLAGTEGITGTFAVPIVDSDQVTVTATVDPSITFDIDTATTDTESAAAYTVALGTITTADGRVSGSTDSVNFIWLDISTNASSGAVITVSSTNSALKSTSTPGDTIPSATAAMSNGTSNYGICVVADTETSGGPLLKVAPFASTCAANSETNSVGAVTGSAQNIFTTTSLPISGGRGQIAVNAAISGLQAAHNDYTDVLKFIATGTF